LGIKDGIVYDTIDISLNGVDVDSIIIGGSFSNTNGGIFIGVNSGIFNSTINVLETDGKNLYIGGNFTKNSSIPSDYCVYIPYNDFTNIKPYTFPSPVNSIYFDGKLWIAGNNNNSGIVYLNGTKVDQSNFTNGLTIGQKGSFTDIKGSLVLTNNNNGKNNGAYLYSQSQNLSVNFTVDPNTSIVSYQTNYTDVSLNYV
jgi:hypothetical protein